MDEILDEDLKEEDYEEDRTTSNLNTRVIIYFSIMILGGVALTWARVPEFRDLSISSVFLSSVFMIVLPMLVSLFFDLVKLMIRRIRKQDTTHKIIRNPFWFSVIEGGFGIWIIFAIIVLIGHFGSSL